MPTWARSTRGMRGQVRLAHPGAGVRRATHLDTELAAGDADPVNDANRVEVSGDPVVGVDEVAGPVVDARQLEDLALQPGLLLQLTEGGVARVLAEVDPTAREGPHAVGAGRCAGRNAAQQDRIAVGAQRICRH